MPIPSPLEAEALEEALEDAYEGMWYKLSTYEFIKSIRSSDSENIITNFFDEIMVLYNLVGNRSDLSIYNNSDNMIAIFNIKMDTEKDANALYSNLNNSDFSVYNTVFNISMTIDDNIITTTIQKIN